MISFVVPAYNEEEGIAACILSIQLRAQAYGIPYEIIVVDNNSEDHTGKVAFASGATVLKCSRKGVVHAREAGLWKAKYPYVAFIDADSHVPLRWIGEVIDTLSRKDVVAVSGPLRFYDAKRYNLGAWAFYYFARFFHMFWPTMQGGNYVLKSYAALQSDCLNLDIEFWGEDTMTAIKLATQGKIVLNPRMVMQTSGRRLLQDGAIKTTSNYILNYFWVHWFHKPFSHRYRNFR